LSRCGDLVIANPTLRERYMEERQCRGLAGRQGRTPS
jgi:hypothetical protein